VVVEALVDVVCEVFGSAEDFGCVGDGARVVGVGVVLGVVIASRALFVDVGLVSVPVCIAAGRVGFTDVGVAVADADGSFLPNSVGELGEVPVLFGHDEGLVCYLFSS